jgi:acyl transferase domain-containing protein
LQPPTVPFVSNVTGRWITAAEATDPAYWARHLRHTVRFSDGIATLLAHPGQVVLEVGPGRALTALVRQHPARPLAVVTSLRHAAEDLDDRQAVLTALGRLWELGLEPNWPALHGDRPRNRVSLPTYPFERQRHWIEPGARGAQPTSAHQPDESPEAATDVARWFHVPGWTASPLPDTAAGAVVGDVIVFADGAGIAEQVARQVCGESGGRVVVVQPGAAWLPTDADLRSVSHILYGRTLPAPGASGEHLDTALDRAFFGPLNLAQTLARHELDRAVDVTFLTTGVAQIAGEGTIDPEAATLLGVSRVMPREIAHVTARVVDVVVPAPVRPRAQLTAVLARELLGRAAEPLVAYRGQTRWVETFARQALDQGPSSPFRDGGVYVITGGLGALGLAVAAHLVRTKHARLVLVSRTALPPRAQWDGWLASHPPSDPTAVRIRGVRACEAAGGQVVLATADVADVEALRGVRHQALAAFGAVHGIVHAAGVLDDGLMALETREAALTVLRPKVHGTLALQEVFAADDLDAVVLFSSLSAVLGLEGQADYTAANAFLDAFASAAANTPTPVVSIGWAAWRDVGLAAQAAGARRGKGGRPAIHPWFGAVVAGPLGEASIEVPLGDAGPWMLDEHVTSAGDRVLPGAGYLELATAALAELGVAEPVEVTELLLHQPLVVPPGRPVIVDLHLRPAAPGYELAWRVGDNVYATASARRPDGPPPGRLDIAAIRARCTVRTTRPRGFIDQPFMRFGSRWANVQRIDYGQGEALLELALPASCASDIDQLRLHPALLDMATAGAQALIPDFDRERDFYVPFSCSHLHLYSGLPASVVSHVRLSARTVRDTAVFDVEIADRTGARLVVISGFCMRRLSASTGLTPPTSQRPGAGTSAPGAEPLSAAAVADEMVRSGIDVTGGLDALDRIMRSSHGPRVVVSPLPPAWWLARVEAARRAQDAMPTVSTASPADPVATFDQIESTIASMWHDLLGVTPSALDSEFFALGGQSLSAIRLANRLGRHFHTPIPVAAVFEHPSLGALSALVRNHLGAPPAAAAGGSTAMPPPLVAVPRDQFRRSLTELSAKPGRKPHES